MKYGRILLLILISLPFLSIFLACDGEGEEENLSYKNSLPKAMGAYGEIILVIDSMKYNGPLGEAIRDVFEEDLKGIIRRESLFNIKKVDPRGVTRTLKMATKLVYVATFDDNRPGNRVITNLFTEDSRSKAKENPELFMLRSKDEFALGQEVLYLFGNDEGELINNLRKNKSKLQNLFLSRERERLGKALFSRINSAAAAMSRNKMDIKVSLPASYQFVQEDEGFMWYRQPTSRSDKPDISLFFYMTDYVDESQTFPENIVTMRNEILRDRVFGDPANKNSYIVTETAEPPVFSNTTLDGKYSIEMRGAWKTNNLSMGGSFLSYTTVDADRGKLFYMEGFVYYPNQAHRAPLREIETILLKTKITEKAAN